MPASDVEPVSGRSAFDTPGAAALQSRAAFLLVLGRQLRTDSDRDDGDSEDAERLDVPLLYRDLVRDRVDSVARRNTSDLGVAGLVRKLYDAITLDAATDLLHACLSVPESIVRVAAAALHTQIPWLGERQRAIPILVEGIVDPDELVRDMAATALDRAFADDVSHETDAQVSMRRRQNETSTIVHGTPFGRPTKWWRPRSPFHRYFKQNVAANLYGGSSPFSWSGLYNDEARRDGAEALVNWTQDRPLDHVFAHSHGGNVAMLASEELQMKKLILLSCPVHREYSPNFEQIEKVVSIRTRLDLVILIDRGKQRFRDSRIEEHVLPIWFRHSATRRPDVWKRHNVEGLL